MFDDLLPYYNSELRFMREMAGEFARANPKIAGRLRLSSTAVEDPHVARMIEAFAFLAARTRLKLDDDFPELTQSLLGILQPHTLAAFPSMSVVELAPPVGLDHEVVLPVATEFMTEPVRGEPLRYRTTYPVSIWPIALTAARLSGLPLAAPPNPHATAAVGVLRLSLACIDPDATFGGLGVDTLRFYLHAEARVANILYELILGGTVSIALADSAVDPRPVLLPASAVRSVGFGDAEVSVPLPPAAEPAMAQVGEFFAFPEKFMFFDLTGLSAKTLRDGGRSMEVFLYCDRFDPAIEHLVTRDRFRLSCAPVINLFRERAEPIRLVPGRFDHRVVPDARREAVIEVHSVDEVTVTDRVGAAQPFHPFFAIGRPRLGPDLRYWHTTRRGSPRPDGGDDVFITTIDTAGLPVADAELVASIELTCSNRELPRILPFGEGRPQLTIVGAPDTVGTATFLIAPTDPLRPKRGRGDLWRLISHMSLAHMSVADPEIALRVVKELLVLHDHSDAAAAGLLLERLTAVEGRPATARAPAGGHVVFLHGTDLTLEFDDRRLSGTGSFLLGALLAQVFGAMAALNTFSRTTLRLKGERRAWHRGPARSGSRPII